MSESNSEFVMHTACDECGSSDANALYSDGHTHCFACNTTKGNSGGGDGSPPNDRRARQSGARLLDGEPRALPGRKLSEETCRKFGYLITRDSSGEIVRVLPYRKDGAVSGQKVKPKDKGGTYTVGDVKGCEFFGQHLWRGGGKRLVITTGEEDAMAISQMQGHKWPVVSATKGDRGVVKDIQNNIEFVSSFDEVVLCFDNDESGRQAVDECSHLFKPGTLRVASLPRKDANDMVIHGEGDQLIAALWEAKPWRPDGVVRLKDVLEEAVKPVTMGFPWWLEPMNALTFGRRYGQCIGLGAGTGVGKTDFLTQQILYDMDVLKMQVGIFFLEQPVSETANRLAGKRDGKSYHVPDGSWDNSQRIATITALADEDRLSLYDAFGVTDWDRVAACIRAMVVQDGIRIFYLDHLTALADPSNERESLETIMGQMAMLCQELKIIIHYVSHLSTPESGSHEEGARVSLKHFKGARAIGFWTHFAFGIERDKTADDPAERNVATIRCVKDRFTGRADGATWTMRYDQASARLVETTPFDNEKVEDFGEAFSNIPGNEDALPF